MTKKLHFTKQDESQAAKVLTTVGNARDIVVFRTIQIKSHDPSELTIVVEKKAGVLQGEMTVTHIPLVDFRSSFMFQNGVYILDTRALARFIDARDYFSVRISVTAIEKNDPVDVEVYYHLVDQQQYPEYSGRLVREQNVAEFISK